MQVILLERIEKLGRMGEVVEVKPGFARNYLLPQKKALRATKENLGAFEQQRAQLEALNLKEREDAEILSKKISDVCLFVVRQAGESGQLYGSVAPRDLAESLQEATGVSVKRQQIVIPSAFKTLGVYDFYAVLHPEVKTALHVSIAPSLDEARLQWTKMMPQKQPAEMDPEPVS